VPRRARFGASSEKIERTIAQLELALEDIEAAAAETVPPIPPAREDPPKAKRPATSKGDHGLNNRLITNPKPPPRPRMPIRSSSPRAPSRRMDAARGVARPRPVFIAATSARSAICPAVGDGSNCVSAPDALSVPHPSVIKGFSQNALETMFCRPARAGPRAWNVWFTISALGGRPAASFAKRLMLPVSNDTLLRVVRRRARVPTEPLTVVGIDDFAFRRNCGDSGIGFLHQDFIYLNLISSDLTKRVVAAYEARTDRRLDRQRINVLTGYHRLSELAKLAEDPQHASAVLRSIAAWRCAEPL
jgi:hypothetical protein